MKNLYGTSLSVLLGFTLCSSAHADWDYSRHHDWDRHEHHHDYFWTGIVIGNRYPTPPRGYVRIVVRDRPYYYYEGVYYEEGSEGYTVVNAPMGAIIPNLPEGVVPVKLENTTYYYLGGVYYLPSSAGFVVVTPPKSIPLNTVPPNTVIGSSDDFHRLGHDWAKDLRNDVATRDQFVNYLKSNLIKAPSSSRNEFREGFVSAYGINGEAAFDKAFEKAGSN